MQASHQRSRGELLKVLGIIFGLSAVVGGSVGQGILRTPGIVAGAVPNSALILLLWAAGGAIAALNAVAYAELGSAIPRAGGPYVFVRHAWGATAGIITGWADWLINLSTQAFLAVVVAEFLHRLGIASSIDVAILAPAAILLVFVVNLSHTRVCGSTQTAGSALKGLGLLALVIALFVLGGHDGRQAAAAPLLSNGTGITIGALAIAMRAVQNTFDGWNNCIYFCEEMTAPHKNVAKSLFGGIALVTLLYLLVNAALIYSLGPAGMASSTLPAADALTAAVGGWAGALMTLFGIVTVGAILNLNVMFGPRIAVAMSRDRVLPSMLMQVSSNGSPRVALVVGTAVACMLAASGTYNDLIAFNVALGFLVNSAACLAAIRLRQTEPQLERPWRTPLYPWPILFAVGVNLLLLVAMIMEDAFHSLLGIAAALAIGLLYRAGSLLSARTPARA